jgi:hypothetical protein
VGAASEIGKAAGSHYERTFRRGGDTRPLIARSRGDRLDAGSAGEVEPPPLIAAVGLLLFLLPLLAFVAAVLLAGYFLFS